MLFPFSLIILLGDNPKTGFLSTCSYGVCTATERGRAEDRWAHYDADTLAYELAEEYGGEWAMAKYIEATEMENEGERQEVIDQILLYNREDLEVTWAVLRWLRAKICW